jgi:hypothetical protein
MAAEDMRDEKVKVLKSIRPIKHQHVHARRLFDNEDVTWRHSIGPQSPDPG